MFVEFERTDTTGRPNGPVWINTNSVFTLENYKDSVTEKNLDTGELYSKHVVVNKVLLQSVAQIELLWYWVIYMTPYPNSTMSRQF